MSILLRFRCDCKFIKSTDPKVLSSQTEPNRRRMFDSASPLTTVFIRQYNCYWNLRFFSESNAARIRSSFFNSMSNLRSDGRSREDMNRLGYGCDSKLPSYLWNQTSRRPGSHRVLDRIPQLAPNHPDSPWIPIHSCDVIA